MNDPGSWGVATGYTDAEGRWRDVAPATVAAVLGAMGEPAGASGQDGPIVVRLDRPPVAVPPGLLVTEDGREIRVAKPERAGGRPPAGATAGATLPPDLTAGYHRLEPDGGTPRTLIASPGRCPGPPRRRQWGWSAQLYATRSKSSWGIGDLGDLEELARWSASLRATMALINPLHAGGAGQHHESSPYFPSSRCFPSPLYLHVEDFPGAAEVADVERLGSAGRALNAERMIDRDRVWALKSEALEALFARFDGGAGGSDGGAAFDRFRDSRGGALEGFATWCALAERHGVPWQDWPVEVRHPGAGGVARFAASVEGGRRVRYHAWLQWHLDRQLAAAAAPVGLMQDLAIGVNVGGADAWLWQDSFARDMHVGAPPDSFNTLGQDWGLPPWDPWKLRGAGYGPFVETIRGALRHAGGLRVDHVMGLFRLWWIPDGAPPTDGTYVSYPAGDLLDILALEAARAGAYIVGEDLGTVEDGVRHELAERGVLSYRLVWFEPEGPERWPEQALGAVTTHDLPTVAGAWTGSDLAAQRAAHLAPNEDGILAMRQRLADLTGADDTTPMAEVVERTYAALAGAPCAVVTATLDDVCCVEERPNMPGTTDEWPNWNLALPVPLEGLEELPVGRRVAEHLARGSAGPGGDQWRDPPTLARRGPTRHAPSGADARQADEGAAG
ncbi:MAG TPA: 4-alpha-glucanotransferase [Acidimicrobiales bacterium]|nr:4-alpha-glucanotransferase [Acidimicrobiales bacterium]